MILKTFLIFAFFATSFAQNVPSISCNFTMVLGEYTCLFTINNPEGFDGFDGVEGTHLAGMTNENVTSVTRQAGTSPIVPSVFCNIFSNLQMLSLTGMAIQYITNNPFGACSNLNWLRLWNNEIHEIAEDTWANNPGLTYIDLDRNNLTSLPINVFHGLSNLSILELRNNNFEGRLQGGLFRPLTGLRILYLNHCGIPTINRQWFETLKNLQQLWLYNNKITRVVQDQFIGLASIIYVDLDANQIDTVEARAFYGRQNLSYIYLYNNLITELVEDVFEGAPNLFYIDLDRNRIHSIQDGAFRSMVNLNTLYMDYNNIKNLTSRSFEGLTRLTNLFMNFNEIEDLPEGVFTPIENITNVGLWNNSIKVIHRNYFGDLSSLHYFDLDTNVVNGIERSFIEEAVNLQTLHFWANLCFSGSMFNFQANRNSFMLLLERCFHNHQFIIDATTEGGNNYRFFPFPTPGIQLRVNTPQDAHVSLNPVNFPATPRIEILIGTSNNTRSIIRINGENDVVDVSTPGILEHNSWTGFRIVFMNWMVLVFTERDSFPFMAYNMEEFYPVPFYGIRTPGNVAPWSIQPIG